MHCKDGECSKSKVSPITYSQFMRHSLTDCSKEAPTNPRGIPFAPFVDKVEDYVTTRADVEGALKSFQEMIS